MTDCPRGLDAGVYALLVILDFVDFLSLRHFLEKIREDRKFVSD